MSESRVEEYLTAARTEEKETNLPKPRSRVEALLEKMAGVEYQPRTHYVEKAFEDITWDGDTEGKVAGVTTQPNLNWYKVSDQILTEEDLLGATLIRFDGEVIEIAEKDFTRNVEEVLLCHYPSVVIVSAPTTYVDTTYPSAGVYFMGSSILGHAHSLKAKETVHKLDEKYIPDTIARVADVSAAKDYVLINSSTEGSTKKFKLTIDDNGAIVATEVTE